MVRNKNEVLITRKDPNDTNEYRINLHYIELTLPRFLLNPLDQIRIENIWKTKPIQLIYNRFELYIRTYWQILCKMYSII